MPATTVNAPGAAQINALQLASQFVKKQVAVKHPVILSVQKKNAV